MNFVFASGSNLLMTELAVYNDTYGYLKMRIGVLIQHSK